MIEADLYTHLKNNVASVSGRVFPLIMPQNTTKPALVYTVVNDRDDQSVSGCVASQSVRFQIDVYANSYSESKTVLTAVKASLYTFSSYPMNLNSRDGFEEEEGFFRQIIDFTIRS